MHKRKFSNPFTKIKVQKQLYIIFFMAIFIPTITIGNYLVYHIRSLLIEHYEEQVYSDNLRVKSLLLDLVSNIHYKSNSLGTDKELIHILCTEYDSTLAASQVMEAYDGFTTLLSQDIPVQDVSVYTWNTTLPEGKYIHQITDSVQKENWFKRISTNVAPFWTEEMITDDFGNEDLALCLHSRMFLPQINSYAIINISISNNHIKNRIKNNNLHTALWLNDESVFYCSVREGLESSLYNYTPTQGKYYLGKMDLATQTAIGCISSLSTPYSDDWFYITTLNYDSYSHITKVTGTYLAILLLILLITSIFISAYSRYFSQRVITLRKTMHNASLGNYNITDTFHGEDEISEAFADLNVMIQDILKKEASVYEAQIRTQELTNQRQQMEFKMLSSQINPHFLYNTLETIRMRSLKAGNREVANAVKLLGKSMRYVLENTTTSFTTLAKELDYIYTYLSIQKLRFHDRVNYSLKTPPNMDLNEYQIMPLLLQPIVENALLHGLEEVEQNGRIIIHITEHDKTLYIKIFDNGCGMTPEEVNQLKQTIYHHPKDSSKSIGLYNIYQRIQLCFGNSYGLQIKSKKNVGTLITMTIPAQEYRRDTEL